VDSQDKNADRNAYNISIYIRPQLSDFFYLEFNFLWENIMNGNILIILGLFGIVGLAFFVPLSPEAKELVNYITVGLLTLVKMSSSKAKLKPKE